MSQEKAVTKVKKVKKPMDKASKKSLTLMLILMVVCIAIWLLGINFLGYGGDVGNVKEEMFPKEAFSITMFGQLFSFSESIVSAWITVGILIVVAVMYRAFIVPRLSTIPGKIQSLMEYLVETFDSMSRTNVHHLAKPLGPIVFSMAAFICVGTLIELLGFRPPNADINTCIGLAITTFILINYYGLKEKGLKKRLLHYLLPIPLIPLITDIAVPVSMTFRLFGSILSGFLIMAIIWVAMPAVVPGFLSIMFTLFHALIQSYVFAILSLTFIGEAVE